MKNNYQSNRGFIPIIIGIIVIILVLTFFRVDLRSLVESEAGQSNFGYLWELLGRLWDWLWGMITDLGRRLADWLASLTN